MRGEAPEQVPAAVGAFEVAVGPVLPGDADGAVQLDHLARCPSERLRAVDLDRGGTRAEVCRADEIGCCRGGQGAGRLDEDVQGGGSVLEGLEGADRLAELESWQQ